MVLISSNVVADALGRVEWCAQSPNHVILNLLSRPPKARFKQQLAQVMSPEINFGERNAVLFSSVYYSPGMKPTCLSWIYPMLYTYILSLLVSLKRNHRGTHWELVACCLCVWEGSLTHVIISISLAYRWSIVSAEGRLPTPLYSYPNLSIRGSTFTPGSSSH